jgi:hypothetical protein
MSASYYLGLWLAYATGLLGWVLLRVSFPRLWPSGLDYQFQHPWRETLFALLAALATVAIGQLAAHGKLLPEVSAVKTPIADLGNQVIIFSPFLFLLAIRRQPLRTAWLPARHAGWRLLAGVLLALCAAVVFAVVRHPPGSLVALLASVYHPRNTGYAAQVFLEDVAIAVLFMRLRAALGERRFLAALFAVAFLFSAAHYPQHLRDGLSTLSATRMVMMDGLLASAVIYVLQRSNDILWFWPIHFSLDMMQFYAGNPRA